MITYVFHYLEDSHHPVMNVSDVVNQQNAILHLYCLLPIMLYPQQKKQRSILVMVIRGYSRCQSSIAATWFWTTSTATQGHLYTHWALPTLKKVLHFGKEKIFAMCVLTALQ